MTIIAALLQRTIAAPESTQKVEIPFIIVALMLKTAAEYLAVVLKEERAAVVILLPVLGVVTPVQFAPTAVAATKGQLATQTAVCVVTLVFTVLARVVVVFPTNP